MQERILYMLMPFDPSFDHVREAVNKAAEHADFKFQRADSKLGVVNIVNKIIRDIYNADVVVADLTGKNGNVLYELGIANALSKECILICQERPEDLPFDVKHVSVVQYSPDSEGLSRLTNKIVSILKSEDPIESPFNEALDDVLKRSRTLIYSFWGSVGGAAIGFLASLVSCAIGKTIYSVVYSGDLYIQTLGFGVIVGFLVGGIAFATLSITYNIFRHQLKRTSLVISETLAGSLCALIVATVTVAGTLRLHLGPTVAVSLGALYIPIFVLMGLTLGLSFEIRPPRAQAETLLSRLAKSFASCTLYLIIAVAFMKIIGPVIVLPPFNFDFVGTVSDISRIGIGCMGLSILQWWLSSRKNKGFV